MIGIIDLDPISLSFESIMAFQEGERAEEQAEAQWRGLQGIGQATWEWHCCW